MGAANSASLDRADPVEVGLRLAALLRARWFAATDESAHPRTQLQQDEEVVGARNMMLDVSSQPLSEFLQAGVATPARRELTEGFWEFDAFKAFALAAVRADERLSKLSYRAVPRHVTESEFWRIYFVNVYQALAEASAAAPAAKSRRLTSMTSPKRLHPLSLPRGGAFVRHEPWARVGEEVVWLLSHESQSYVAGKMHGGATLTEGPQSGVAAFSFESPCAVFELSATAAIESDWTIAAWIWAAGGSGGSGGSGPAGGGNRCLVSSDTNEQAVCAHGGELGVYIAAAGFSGCGFDLGVLDKGWFHLAAVGSGGKTSFYLNGLPAGVADAQSEEPIKYVGNAPPLFLGEASQPFGQIADFRVFSRAVDEADILALSQMVPASDRPAVPPEEAIASFQRHRELLKAVKNLEGAAEMIAAAETTLGEVLHEGATYDLTALREQLLKVSQSAQDASGG